MKAIYLYVITFLSCHAINSQDLATVAPAFEMLSKYPNIRDIALSPSGNEAYFTIQSPLEEISIIANIKKESGVWLEPKMVSFSGRYKDLEPFLAPDGLRLYFASNRPLADSIGQPKDFDIWYVQRTTIDAAWGRPINVGSPINTEHNEFYPSITQNNNLYFTSDAPSSKGKDDIFYSAWNNDRYASPLSLSGSINTEGYEFNAYVSPDESFIIFSGYNREDGLGSGDLYISHKDEAQNWGVAANLGESINSKYMDYCPFMDLNSQTLYFTSRRSSIVKTNTFQSLEDFENEIGTYENGMSRIYKVAIPEKLLLPKQ